MLKITYQPTKRIENWEMSVGQLLLKKGVEVKLQERISALVKELCDGMHEREEIVAVSLLAALCGQNTFLYGPPGTAKSLISRRITSAFENPTYFEYLMHRFSTPEEVFGPVSIKELKEDRYVRKTGRYLPKAEFAFLDEIWKSSPSILNTLLTLINEHIFKNGEDIEPSPLKALIAASNETPGADQGLDALYDRFIVRLLVGPIQNQSHFEELLNSKPTPANHPISQHLRINNQEWEVWKNDLHDVKLSKETTLIIKLVRDKIKSRENELKVYVSDRRWQRAAMLMKAAALFNNRSETNHSDAILLQHCLWTAENNLKQMHEIVADAIRECGFVANESLDSLDKSKNNLELEVNNELYHTTDVYDKKLINGNYFFSATVNLRQHGHQNNIVINIPESKLKSKGEFIPLDNNLNQINRVRCEFDGQGVCKINWEDGYGYSQQYKYTPTILFHKGDKKQNINTRLIKSLGDSIAEIRNKLQEVLADSENKLIVYNKELSSPFVPEEKLQIPLQGITRHIAAIKLRIADCDRLEALCR